METESKLAAAAAENEDEVTSTTTADADNCHGEIARILFTMPYAEVMLLSDLDDQYASDPTSVTDEVIAQAAATIPNLSVEQIKSLLTRERDA